MTWGSHCPQCGKEECRWTLGLACEGNSPKPPHGFRLSIAEADFCAGWYFYIEERRIRGWLWPRAVWEESSHTRSRTAGEAIAAIKRRLEGRIRK